MAIYLALCITAEVTKYTAWQKKIILLCRYTVAIGIAEDCHRRWFGAMLRVFKAILGLTGGRWMVIFLWIEMRDKVFWGIV